MSASFDFVGHWRCILSHEHASAKLSSIIYILP
jgi:hypothetical protein